MKFTIKVPATSANLGPGFDTLGLALDLWNEIKLSTDFETDKRIKRISVVVRGEGAGLLAPNEKNLIVRAAQRLAERAGKPLPPFYAECVNRIPLSSGMGSSSAAIVTGLLAANALLGNPFSREEILNLACEVEGHPDNVAPAMMGGLVVSTVEGGRVIARKISIMGEQGGHVSNQGGHIGPPLRVTIALPNFYLPTKQARAALPKKVSMRNAIRNISRTALVIEALRVGDLDLLSKVMTDKLHQPYRLKLIPGAASAMEAAKEAGASAVALSGAGPSVIAFSTGEAGIGESMKRAYEAAGVEARIFRLGVVSRGAEVRD